jgi:hypothetical protein
MELLIRLLAIPLSPKVRGKRLVIAIPLSCQKALHSHSAKSPKYGDISRWLTTDKWLVMAGHPDEEKA